MTRRSTPKHEVISADRSFVIVSGKSRTECEAIAREMNRGVPQHRHVSVRLVRQATA